MRKITLIVPFLCAFLACGIFASENSHSVDQSLQRELIIIDIAQDFDLNPHTASYASEAQTLNSLYEGLFSYHPYSLEAEPALAESFRLSRDRLTWTFTLREKTVFSNGEPITAETVRASWLTMLKIPDAPFASLLDCIVGVEDYRTGKVANASRVGITASDARTLTVKLNTPTEYLSKILCHHAFAAVHTDKKVFSGPYVLDVISAEEIILRKNAAYWDAVSVVLPSIKIMLSDDVEKNTYLFNVGKADWVTADIDSQRIFDTAAIKLAPQFGSEYLFFKTTKAPFNNEDFRNALVSAVPWDELRKSAFVKASSLLLRLPEYPAVNGLSDQNLDDAKNFLTKSGVDPQKTVVTIAMPDVVTAINKAETLKTAWEELGLTVVIEKAQPARYINTVKNSKADVFSYIWIGDYADPTAFLELFRGNSTLNESGWKNSKFDALLVEAAKMSDSQQRYKKLAEAEQVLLDSGVIMPISHTVSFNVIDTGSISGWYDNALNIHPFKYLRFVQPKALQNVVKH